MEKIIIQKFVNNESELHQFDAKKVASMVLNVPKEDVFPFLIDKGKELAISLSIEVRDSRDRGFII